ncbi:T9SS type A sorting domain-containing protein [Pontibacter chitinilyticus]|uniref:T9SS type A sorting domain-containing protein n=1 Tax=Pontibacter chitinilyticus TaxID=2674989 RepID=UPI00321A2B33
MKRNLFLLFALLLLSLQSFAQVAGSSFEMYVIKYRFGPRSLDYFQSKNIEVTNYLSHSSIEQTLNVNKVDETKVRQALAKLFPYSTSGGKLILNWERPGVFKALRDYPNTDSRYKYAEGEWRRLISIVRDMRPNVKIGIYGITFKGWKDSTVGYYNPQGKYDALLSLVDFLAPSVYIQFADEEVGHERNLQYIRDNMDAALDCGRRLNKPVYPFLWSRIHDTNQTYGYELIQTDVFAQYVKLLSTYSYNGYKAKGFYWWESGDKTANLSQVNGINNWAKGMVTNYDTYDALMVKYAAAVVKTLSGSTTTTEPEPAPAPTPTTDGNSFTLVNADTDTDIKTLTSGATINLAALPTKHLNIRYNSGSSAGSIVFRLSGAQSKSRTESGAPYALAGDSNGDYYSWTPAVGSYTLKATPYSLKGGSGTAGTTLSVNFTVVSNTSSSIGVTSIASNATAISSTSESSLSTDVLTVYPVPATIVLYVDLGQETGEGDVTLELKDFNGKTVLTQKQNTTTSGRKAEIDISGVQEGVYILVVTSSTGRATKRVVIDR